MLKLLNSQPIRIYLISPLLFGINLAVFTSILCLRKIALGDYNTPLIIREGNISSYKSLIISSSILQGFLLAIALAVISFLLSKIIKNTAGLRLTCAILSVVSFLVIMGKNSSTHNKLNTERETYESQIIKSEEFIRVMLSGNYDTASTAFKNSDYFNSFISSQMYKKLLNKIYRKYGSDVKINKNTLHSLNSHNIISFSVTHTNKHELIYHVALDQLNRITGFYITAN